MADEATNWPRHTKMLTYVKSVFLSLTLLVANDVEPNVATVQSADLQVYAGASLDSTVVKTLHKGERVFVVLEIMSSGPAWCRIREENQNAPSGYVLCKQLDRPQRTSRSQWSGPPVETLNGDRLAGEVTTQSPASRMEGHRVPSDPNFWVEQFSFSDEQRQRSEELQQDSGLAACQASVEQMYRDNGISDPATLLKALGRMGKSSAGMAEAERISTELDRCGVRYGAFWKKFLNLMSPEQKAELGKQPDLLLFLVQTQSDPAVAFGFFALSQMKLR